MVGDFTSMLRLISKMAAGSTNVYCKHKNYLLVSEETRRFMKALFCVDNFRYRAFWLQQNVSETFQGTVQAPSRNTSYLLYWCVIKIVLIFTAAAGAGV